MSAAETLAASLQSAVRNARDLYHRSRSDDGAMPVDVARHMYRSVEIRDRKVCGRVFNRTFTGRLAIQFLLSNMHARSHDDAVRICHMLLDNDIITHADPLCAGERFSGDQALFKFSETFEESVDSAAESVQYMDIKDPISDYSYYNTKIPMRNRAGSLISALSSVVSKHAQALKSPSSEVPPMATVVQRRHSEPITTTLTGIDTSGNTLSNTLFRSASHDGDKPHVHPWIALEDCLASTEGINCFDAYLAREKRRGLLEFWLAAEAIRTGAVPPSNLIKVYEEYIAEDAPKQINLGDALQDLVQRRLNSPDKDSLLESQTAVKEELRGRHWANFLGTYCAGAGGGQ